MREPVEGDIPLVVRLASEHSPEPRDEATLRQEWSAPRVDLELDARVEDGAYVLVERLDEERVWMGSTDGRRASCSTGQRHGPPRPAAFVPDLWFLAHENGEPAGIAICHPHRTRAELGWIRILGVRRPWRRRGLGRALLLHAFAEFRSRGLATAGLGVDAESLTGANRLYEDVGMRVASRFDIYEKALS